MSKGSQISPITNIYFDEHKIIALINKKELGETVSRQEFYDAVDILPNIVHNPAQILERTYQDFIKE